MIQLFEDFYTIYGWAANLFYNDTFYSFYPLPFIYIFQVFVLLPKEISAIIFSVIIILLLVDILKRDIFRWVFFFPLLVHLHYGQVSIIFYWLYSKGTPLTIALMSLKPQTLLFALPRLVEWFRTDRSKLWRLVIYLIGIWAPFFIIRPGWISEWLYSIRAGNRAADLANSISFILHPELLILYAIFLLLFAKYITINGIWNSAIIPINIPLRFYDVIFMMNKRLSTTTIIFAGILVIYSLQFPQEKIIYLASIIPIFAVLEILTRRKRLVLKYYILDRLNLVRYSRRTEQ